ncbi:hypothetical protein DICVIV_00520 [Dictyocaulus viviparus]|uniref:Uncharacterized protein n=1 Tax=Dictyocaulus viviparus TaxID=29172 RepID=A0A0D8YB24_DICVI|nr:hypothetical protein DICVIV_00520 [Dictyocaulus viviparus]
MERGILRKNTNDKLNCARTDLFRRLRAGISRTLTASSAGTVVETVMVKRVVTERKCGGVEDVTGCTLYKSKISRKIRHLLINDHRSLGSVRRETPTLFVEVCSETCPGGECLNSSPKTLTVCVFLTVFLSLYSF